MRLMNKLDNISTRQGSLSADDDGWDAVLLNNINGIYLKIKEQKIWTISIWWPRVRVK